MTPEPFIDATRAAAFLCCSRKHVLFLARNGMIPAVPRDRGKRRRTWLFKLSELDAAVKLGTGRSSETETT
jgi:hypothetical protein